MSGFIDIHSVKWELNELSFNVNEELFLKYDERFEKILDEDEMYKKEGRRIFLLNESCLFLFDEEMIRDNTIEQVIKYYSTKFSIENPKSHIMYLDKDSSCLNLERKDFSLDNQLYKKLTKDLNVNIIGYKNSYFNFSPVIFETFDDLALGDSIHFRKMREFLSICSISNRVEYNDGEFYFLFNTKKDEKVLKISEEKKFEDDLFFPCYKWIVETKDNIDMRKEIVNNILAENINYIKSGDIAAQDILVKADDILKLIVTNNSEKYFEMLDFVSESLNKNMEQANNHLSLFIEVNLSIIIAMLIAVYTMIFVDGKEFDLLNPNFSLGVVFMFIAVIATFIYLIMFFNLSSIYLARGNMIHYYSKSVSIKKLKNINKKDIPGFISKVLLSFLNLLLVCFSIICSLFHLEITSSSDLKSNLIFILVIIIAIQVGTSIMMWSKRRF